jgi:hypothetical protein
MGAALREAGRVNPLALWIVVAATVVALIAVVVVFVRAESSRFRTFDRHMMSDAERARDSARVWEARPRRIAWAAMRRTPK